MEKENFHNRDFSSISPSAKSLLLMKGCTDIPFALQAAGLIEYPKEYVPDFEYKDMTFWARVVHFESRYKSVDQLLADLPVKNIFELSSGYSFRGLEVTKRKGYHYIDTDLPDVISVKRELVSALRNDSFGSESELELLPLNALDEEAVHDVISHFPEGEIAIINEGLLMYLNGAEREHLCKIIHKILKERGGYWVTADIYLKGRQDKLKFKLDDRTQEFFDRHNMEGNKFISFEEAESFFRRMGFIIDREADVPSKSLSSLKYLVRSATLRQLFRLRKGGKIQATWRLKVEDDSAET